jgi:hypothetical protein
MAVYSGDAVYAGSIAALTLTVQQDVAGSLLMSNSTPSESGQAVTFMDSVQSAGGSTPTGTVTFLDRKRGRDS